MLSFFLHAIGALVCFGAGYYVHFRYGDRVAADLQKVKSVV